MPPACTILKILKINPVESGIAKHSHKPYEWHTAECVLLCETGDVMSVGRLVVPKKLRESLGGMPPLGTYRATISLALSATHAGDIVPQITDLTPVDV